jgi:hypothetical protein
MAIRPRFEMVGMQMSIVIAQVPAVWDVDANLATLAPASERRDPITTPIYKGKSDRSALQDHASPEAPARPEGV